MLFSQSTLYVLHIHIVWHSYLQSWEFITLPPKQVICFTTPHQESYPSKSQVKSQIRWQHKNLVLPALHAVSLRAGCMFIICKTHEKLLLTVILNVVSFLVLMTLSSIVSGWDSLIILLEENSGCEHGVGGGGWGVNYSTMHQISGCLGYYIHHTVKLSLGIKVDKNELP